MHLQHFTGMWSFPVIKKLIEGAYSNQVPLSVYCWNKHCFFTVGSPCLFPTRSKGFFKESLTSKEVQHLLRKAIQDAKNRSKLEETEAFKPLPISLGNWRLLLLPSPAICLFSIVLSYLGGLSVKVTVCNLLYPKEACKAVLYSITLLQSIRDKWMLNVETWIIPL